MDIGDSPDEAAFRAEARAWLGAYAPRRRPDAASGGPAGEADAVRRAKAWQATLFDAVVVGVPDDRWGSRVAAVVQPRPGAEPPTLESLDAHCRRLLAAYKVPRQVHVVDEVVRSPAGKPDYPWAQRIAAGSEN